MFHFVSFINIYTWWPLRSKVCFTGAMLKTNYNNTYKEITIYIQLNEILRSDIIYRTKQLNKQKRVPFIIFLRKHGF